MFCGTDNIPWNISHILQIGKYFVDYCEFHITLLWIWIMSWIGVCSWNSVSRPDNHDVTLLRSITVSCGVGSTPRNISHIQFANMEYFVECCQSHITLLWISIMLWIRVCSWNNVSRPDNHDITLFRSIIVFCGTESTPRSISHFQFAYREYSVKYCPSHITLLWIWIMLWIGICSWNSVSCIHNHDINIILIHNNVLWD